MVKKEKVTVLLDMDGVLCDLVSGVEYLYNTKFDFTEGSYYFYEKLGISQYELELVVDDGSPEAIPIVDKLILVLDD